MFCTNCGKQISEQADICIHCGVRIIGKDDKPNWAVNLITLCCFPFVGLIIYFAWKNENPTAAQSALLFFFIHIAIIILFYVAIFLFGLLEA